MRLKFCIQLTVLAGVMLYGGLPLVAHSALPNQETSGITLHNTRVIFPASEKRGVSYTLTNNTDNLYLLQARVVPFEGKTENTTETQPIVVLPPLQRFEPHERQVLRLRVVDEHKLPTDRESVFALTLKAIPSQSRSDVVEDKNAAENKGPSGVMLQLAVQNNLKVFYRPQGIAKLTPLQVSQQLQAHRQGTSLIIKNPTAYYVTFGELSVDGNKLSSTDLKRMVPPFGQQTYSLPERVQGGEVRWRTLSDYGSLTEEQHLTLK
ncbi:gram-negative pili assembly chaperone domain protein [Providencia rettgeri DSM 1131]|uniref:fimbrial biogenesis chaperone n=1 Tax=Providencia rettgeri TaxID=587 RepID=UPI000197C016|nr:molecular chaperone [Providencia rettgeri]EFE54095.1 gram-negative pili assembly chaperone domain protein [Providencia rettgeri DSM 1131]QXA57390.1 molecular chaperone [Providencia rettgeri]